MPMIEVSRLSKRYRAVRAVDALSFEIEAGVVMGFLGPNGAGKTTTLRILAGFIGFDDGTVRVAGHDITTERHQAVQRIGYMPESAPMYPEMRVGEYLRFRSEIKGVARRDRRREVGRVLEAAAVADMEDVTIGHLSKGYRQRAGIADALLGTPDVLILDEPSAGLDPNQIGQLRRLIRRLGEKHTVLLSTHILSEVEATCDRALVIDHGHEVASGTIAEISEGFGRGQLELVVGRQAASAVELLKQRDEVAAVEVADGPEEGTASLRVRLAPDHADQSGEATEALVFALTAGGVGVRAVTAGPASLERVFSALTTAHAAGEPAGARGDEQEGA